MARARFENLDSPGHGIFVVKISGHLGTQEKTAIAALLRRCRDEDRHRLALELSELQSMGGSIARQLGTWAEEMAELGHPLAVVDASDTVRSHLEARCPVDAPPVFVDTVTDLASVFASGADEADDSDPDSSDPEGEPATESEEPVAAAPPLEDEETDEGEDTGRAEAPAASDEPDEEEAEDEIEALLDQTLAFESSSSGERTAVRTLAQAQGELARAHDLRQVARVVVELLRGSELVEEVSLFCLEGDGYVFTESTVLRSADFFIPASGALVETLRRLDEPVPRLQLAMKLAEDEKRVFDRLRSDLAIPFFVDHELQAIAIVGTRRADYEKAEILALDLLARHIGSGIAPRSSDDEDAPSEKEQELGRQLRRQRTVLRLCRELHSIESEDRLMSRLLISLIGEMGISGAVLYRAEDDHLHPAHVYGFDESSLPELHPPAMRAVSRQTRPLSPVEADPEEWGEAIGLVAQLGVDLLVPLRGPRRYFGVLALAVRRSREEGLFDPAYLEALLQHAGLAAEHVRTVRELEEQTLEVAKTLITLIEQKSDASTSQRTELVARYVQRVAERLDYDSDTARDLLYGSVLRDIGMIEIGELVLKSPRNLSDEEWKQVEGHPRHGAEILRRMNFSRHTCQIVQHHHERFNGRGYPAGLRGDAIPLGARIVAVVESYVAMIHDLPYRPALDPEEAVEVLRENFEMRYDPRVVDAFLRVLEEEGSRSGGERVGDLLAG